MMQRDEDEIFFEDDEHSSIHFQTSWGPVRDGKKKHSSMGHPGKRERSCEEGKGSGKGKHKYGKGGGKGKGGFFKCRQYGMKRPGSKSVPEDVCEFKTKVTENYNKMFREAGDGASGDEAGGETMFTFIKNTHVVVQRCKNISAAVDTTLKNEDFQKQLVFIFDCFKSVETQNPSHGFRDNPDFDIVYLFISFIITNLSMLMNELPDFANATFTKPGEGLPGPPFGPLLDPLEEEDLLDFYDNYDLDKFQRIYENETNTELVMSVYGARCRKTEPPLNSCIDEGYLREFVNEVVRIGADVDFAGLQEFLKEISIRIFTYCGLCKDHKSTYAHDLATAFLSSCKDDEAYAADWKSSYNRVSKPIAGVIAALYGEPARSEPVTEPAKYLQSLLVSMAHLYTKVQTSQAYAQVHSTVLECMTVFFMLQQRAENKVKQQMNRLKRIAKYTSLDRGLHGQEPELYGQLLKNQADADVRLGNILPVNLDIDDDEENEDEESDAGLEEELLQAAHVPHSRIYYFEHGIIKKTQLSYYIRWAIQRGFCTVKWTLTTLKGMSMAFDYFSSLPEVTDEHRDDLQSDNTYELRRQIGTLHNEHWFKLHELFCKEISNTNEDDDTTTVNAIMKAGIQIMKRLEIDEFTFSKMSSPLLLELCRTTMQSIIDATPFFREDKDVNDIDLWFRRFPMELIHTVVLQSNTVRVTMTDLITKQRKTTFLENIPSVFDFEARNLQACNTNFYNLLYRIVETVHLAQEAKRDTFTTGLTNAKYANMLRGARHALKYFLAKVGRGASIYKMEVNFLDDGEQPLYSRCIMYGMST